ncbi:helix-turn-helix domain-containing protein [Bartonella sp. CB60]|uniref:helix-turn-helix domain-containing protein n=1 Tax=Bartonella sp. CB60 TaxID=3113619 RepID=UPI00300E323C
MMLKEKKSNNLSVKNEKSLQASLIQSVSPFSDVKEIKLADRHQIMKAIMQARIEKKMTLMDVAWASGVSWDAVRSWYHGHREPKMGNIVAVAQTLGLEIVLRKEQKEKILSKIT